MKSENQVFVGTCPQYLRKFDSSFVDMVYIDPPFFTQENRELKNRFTNKKYSYSDIWPGLETYLNWLSECLKECYRILKRNGSIFVHCDWRAAHHIRMFLDKTFGRDNFRNEIIWNYRRWTNPGEFLQRTHQTIFFYAMSEDTEINKLYESYSDATNLDQIWQKRTNSKAGRSKYEEKGNGFETHDKAKKGVRMRDVWDIPVLNPKAKERVGYPTQKPIELLERIILLATNEGDLVFDPCCGSGTTLVAAKLHNRRWIGIDKSNQAIDITRKRLKNPVISRSKVTEHGREYFREPVNTENRHLRYLLEMIKANPVYRNPHLDGFLQHTPSGKPAGIMLVSNSEDYESKREAFLRELKRTKTPQGVIIAESDVRETQRSLFNNQQPGVILVELFESQVIENQKIVQEKLPKTTKELQAVNNSLETQKGQIQ